MRSCEEQSEPVAETLPINRAEQLIDAAAERTADLVRRVGLGMVRVSAVVQEEAEDVWVDAGTVCGNVREQVTRQSEEYGERLGGLIRCAGDRLLDVRAQVQRELHGIWMEARGQYERGQQVEAHPEKSS
jgi:hypothetical protein